MDGQITAKSIQRAVGMETLIAAVMLPPGINTETAATKKRIEILNSRIKERPEARGRNQIQRLN